MRTEETMSMVSVALKEQIPLFIWMFLMFGIGFVITQYFNLPLITTQQIQTLDVGAVYFNSGMIVFSIFAIAGMFPIIFYLIWHVYLGKEWFASKDHKDSTTEGQ